MSGLISLSIFPVDSNFRVKQTTNCPVKMIATYSHISNSNLTAKKVGACINAYDSVNKWTMKWFNAKYQKKITAVQKDYVGTFWHNIMLNRDDK